MNTFALMGTDKCMPSAPTGSMRVWYQRTATGSGTIYLFSKKPRAFVRGNYADHAFGWIPTDVAQGIWLPHSHGWCNFWNGEGAIAYMSGFGRSDGHIGFTDDSITDMASPLNMKLMGRDTDVQRQNRHWLTSDQSEPVVSAQPKEPEMGNFDPYTAQADQQRRLAAKQGSNVSLKDKCGTAVDTIVSNNKVAVKAAAFQEVGRIANNQAAKLLSKHLPAMARGYADTPIGKLLIANLAITAQQHFKPNDPTLAKVVAAMGTQAYADILKSFDIEGFINGVMSDKALQNALTAASDD